jgi:hypothetical protein
MTLQELADTLPNGFHDAQVSRVELNYAEAEAKIHLMLWTSGDYVPGVSNSEEYRPAMLILTGLQYFVIAPPNYGSYRTRGLTVDMGDDAEPPLDSKLLDPSAFQNWFFVSEWNSLLQVSATDAALIWTDGEE